MFVIHVTLLNCKFLCLCYQLPVGSKVSADCQDLLLALLQRDPLARISFEEFFAHAFLDLEHVPSPLCLEKAVSNDIYISPLFDYSKDTRTVNT